MNIKIAVPKNQFFKPLYQNSGENSDILVYTLGEKECLEYLLSNRVDAALLNPLTYSKGADKSDFRIIPAGVMGFKEYISGASVFFNTGIAEINSCAVASEDDFIVTAAMLVFSEKYGIKPEIIISKGNLTEMLRQADVAVVWEKNSVDDAALDISDEWFDSFEYLLPLAFWVCKSDDFPENITEILDSISGVKDVSYTEINDGQTDGRAGSIITRWSDEFEKALEACIYLLYYHQMINEIAAVKILGRD